MAAASDLTRRAGRFVLVARRLEGQMERIRLIQEEKSGAGETNGGVKGGEVKGEGEKERELAKAALSVAELGRWELRKGVDLIDGLLERPDGQEEGLPLDSLDFVKGYTTKVDGARDTIIQEMESMVVNGLADLASLVLPKLI